jgi:guanylate kinase
LSEPADSSAELQAPTIGRRGLLLVLSSPSGAGKTTLSKRLLEADASLGVSVSVTTRAPRRGEVDGKDYHFVSEAEFKRRLDDGELLEWAVVHGNSYASPRGPVEAALASGRDTLFDIDWQGARQIRDKMSADVVSVFILPPTGKALERRLTSRGQDSAEVVARRIANAAGEIAHWGEYDYVVVNSDIDASFATLSAILAAERHKRTRQIGLPDFVNGVLADL